MPKRERLLHPLPWRCRISSRVPRHLAPALPWLENPGNRLGSTHEFALWFSRDQMVVLLSFSSLQSQVELDARIPFHDIIEISLLALVRRRAEIK